MVQLTGAELGAANIKTVQKAIGDWGEKGADAYLAHCGGGDDFVGDVLGGIIPGGANIKGMKQWSEYMQTFGEHVEPGFKFEPCNWGHSEDGTIVYFTVNWEVTFKTGPYAGIPMKTTANIRKHMCDGKIVQKYHIFSVPENAYDELQKKLNA